MLRRILKVTLVLVGLWAVGQAVARRLSEGDAESDEFTIATVFGGVERASRAPALH